MHLVAVMSAIVVGVVLLFAGVTKLVDRKAWVNDAAGLGVQKVVAVFVPFIECALGIGLMVGVIRPVLSLSAAGLLGAMTLVLAKKLMDDNPPTCACFGRFSRKQISVGDVSRNLALVTLAVIAAIAN